MERRLDVGVDRVGAHALVHVVAQLLEVDDLPMRAGKWPPRAVRAEVAVGIEITTSR